MVNYKTKTFIAGILLLIIFLCLLLLFLPNKYNTNFNNNLLLFEERGKNYIYYNILPIKNDRVITLKELYELNIIPILKDKQGNSCIDSASYILIKKGNANYKLSTTLVCKNEVGTIVTYLN